MSERASATVDPPSGSSPVTLGSVVLDTDEPRRLADFYAALLGWRVTWADDEWVEIRPSVPGGDALGVAKLAFQLVINYRPPTWPTQTVPQQYHLDFYVSDLDEGEAFALSVGARRMPPAGVDSDFRVFLDPSGHPFCLCRTR
jgi:hypothetical protein